MTQGLDLGEFSLVLTSSSSLYPSSSFIYVMLISHPIHISLGLEKVDKLNQFFFCPVEGTTIEPTL